MTVELTPEQWAQVRYEYEHTDKPVGDICADNAISPGTLRDRMRRWGWTRRRQPIPAEGPPLMLPVEPALPLVGAPPLGVASPEPGAAPRDGAAGLPVPHAAQGEEAPTDPAEIVPRLQGAVARVLPAIEATVGKLAAGPMPPREMERAARTLTSLTRTLRELHELLRQYPAPSGDRGPEDPDEFALELMRRLDAFKAAHGLQTDADDQHQGSSSAQPEA